MPSNWTRHRRPLGPPPWKTVFAAPCLHLGGLETRTATLLRHLDPALFTPTWFVGDVKGGETTVPAGIPLVVHKPAFEWSACPPPPEAVERSRREARQVFVELNPDIVVGSLCHGALFAANDCGVPVLAEIHDCGASWDVLDHPSDFAIAVSQYVAQRVGERRPNLPPAHVVLNGVDTEQFRYDAAGAARVREEHGLGDAPVMGYAGRIAKEKDPVAWAQLYRLMREEVPGLRGLVVGQLYDESWGMMQALLARGNLLAEVVQVEATFAQMAAYLSAMDVLVHLRRDEPFGLVTVEALLCGTPVIGRDRGGTREIAEALGRPKCMVLAKADMEHMLAQRGGRLLRARQRCDDLRPLVVEKFSAERMARETTELILRYIGEAQRTSRSVLAERMNLWQAARVH